MKKPNPLLIFLTALCIVVSAGAQDPKDAPAVQKKRMIGTWERTDLPAQYRQVKSFTDTHFTWVAYTVADGNVVAVGGGTYTFDGTICKEKYEYGSGNIQGFVKKDPPSFTITFKDEGWIQEGKTPEDVMIRETYRRVK